MIIDLTLIIDMSLFSICKHFLKKAQPCPLLTKQKQRTVVTNKKKILGQQSVLHSLVFAPFKKSITTERDAFLQDSFHEFYKTAGVLDATFITVIIQLSSCQACSLKAFDMNDRDLVFFDKGIFAANTKPSLFTTEKEIFFESFFQLLSQWTTGNRYIGIVPTKNITQQIINRENIFDFCHSLDAS